MTIEDSNRFRLVNYPQAIDFVNSVYLPCDPVNTEVYECREIKIKDILALLWKYFDLFDTRNTNSLGKWIKSSKTSLLNAPDTKRIFVTDSSESETVRFRDLFVIKDEFIMDTLKNITTCMHDYQQYIKSLKEQNFCIIGYARKSNGSEKEEVRRAIVLDLKRLTAIYQVSLEDSISFLSSNNDDMFYRDDSPISDDTSDASTSSDMMEMERQRRILKLTNDKVNAISLDDDLLSCKDWEDLLVLDENDS